MPYYPKTKIQTDLFSNGELIRSSDFTNYVGPYYKLSNGQRYVGRDPQALRYPELLIDLKEFTPPITPTSSILVTQRALDNNLLTSLSGSENYVQNLKEEFVPRKIPVPYYPEPNEQDYQIGYFTRYFAKQVNAPQFTEINKSTFEGLASHDESYFWQLYNPTSIPWQISGNVEKVFTTNRKIIKLEEKNGFKGLSFFLREDYLKFYQGSTQGFVTGSFKDMDSRSKFGSIK